MIGLQALVNAGGKGSRMGKCGVEKPMQLIGDKHVVQRVVEALSASSHIDRLLVSVSDNTPETERYLNSIGVETIRTSGESFMDDLHEAFRNMQGDYILTCPSDLPLLTTEVVDTFMEYFAPRTMQSAIAVVDKETVVKTGITPSYTREYNGREWVVSGLSIMNRPRTLAGDYLEEYIFETDWVELAINVNTLEELELARRYFTRSDDRPSQRVIEFRKRPDARPS